MPKTTLQSVLTIPILIVATTSIAILLLVFLYGVSPVKEKTRSTRWSAVGIQPEKIRRFADAMCFLPVPKSIDIPGTIAGWWLSPTSLKNYLSEK